MIPCVSFHVEVGALSSVRFLHVGFGSGNQCALLLGMAAFPRVWRGQSKKEEVSEEAACEQDFDRIIGITNAFASLALPPCNLFVIFCPRWGRMGND